MKRAGLSERILWIAIPALLALFVGVPMGFILVETLRGGPEAFESVMSASSRAALANSLELGAGVALIAVAAGAPLGAALARLRVRGKTALGTLLVLPLAAPSYVWAMAWIALAAPRAGWLNQLMGAPRLNVYGLPGIVWVEGLALYPLVLLPVRAALEAADPSLEEAARIGGAGPLRAFFTGSAPLALPAAISGTMLAFLAAISSFGVPYLLGVATERPALVATTRIYQALSLGGDADKRGALALCLVLLVFAIGAALLSARAARGARPSGAGKGRRISTLDAPLLSRTATIAAWGFASIAVILPIGAVILSALTEHYGKPPTPSNLTTSRLVSILGKRDVREALLHSAVLAIGSATAVVIAGTGIAFLRRMHRSTASAFLARVAEAPYAVPGSVLALAFLLAFAQPVRFIFAEKITFVFEVAGTLWILGLAYGVKYLAFGVRAADDALRAIDPSLEEAARISGATPGRAFMDAALPLARPALAAAWILVFLPAATELTMSALLTGPRTQVLGTVLFELASYADPPSAAVLACVVLALAVGADVILRRVVGGSRIQGAA